MQTQMKSLTRNKTRTNDYVCVGMRLDLVAKRAPKVFLCFEKCVQSRPNRPLLTNDIITSPSWKSTGIMKLMLAEYHLAASVSGSFHADSLSLCNDLLRLYRTQPSLMLTVTPALFQRGQVKMSAVKTNKSKIGRLSLLNINGSVC